MKKKHIARDVLDFFMEQTGEQPLQVGLRGLHSTTFQLNVSTFCWVCWVHDFPLVY